MFVGCRSHIRTRLHWNLSSHLDSWQGARYVCIEDTVLSQYYYYWLLLFYWLTSWHASLSRWSVPLDWPLHGSLVQDACVLFSDGEECYRGGTQSFDQGFCPLWPSKDPPVRQWVCEWHCQEAGKAGQGRSQLSMGVLSTHSLRVLLSEEMQRWRRCWPVVSTLLVRIHGPHGFQKFNVCLSLYNQNSAVITTVFFSCSHRSAQHLHTEDNEGNSLWVGVWSATSEHCLSGCVWPCHGGKCRRSIDWRRYIQPSPPLYKTLMLSVA